ncbi:MAG: hypothetical protein AAGB25_08585, partial [Pseudomonadota bacterium]
MLANILAVAGVVIVLLLLVFLIYRAARTFDPASEHAMVAKKGADFHGAITSPITIWDPKIKVLREKDAPDIAFTVQSPEKDEYYERSLVTKRTGEISLRIQTGSPRPFVAMTNDRHRYRIFSHITFQLDVDRIQTPCQLQNFGMALSSRLENLFDNEIGKYKDEELRARQEEIETAVTSAMQAIEAGSASAAAGIPLGIIVYEASFSYEEADAVSESEAGRSATGAPTGVMWMSDTQLDRIADVFKGRDPMAAKALMRMMELQTRQNVVEMLAASGTINQFTLEELGLKEVASEI